MSKKHVIPMVLAAGLMAISSSAALAEPSGNDQGPIVRMAILGSYVDDQFRTQAFSISVGSGENFQGATFGDPGTGSIGTAVSNGGLNFAPGIGNHNYETIICTDICGSDEN